jgi:hypothetical protein
MAKRLFVPRTPAEAERFLWHALEHQQFQRNREDFPFCDNVAANTVLYNAIRQLQEAQ